MFKKAAVFTDLHLGMKNNSKMHNEDCENFVDWFIKTAKENDCDTCIFCGDWHHNRNSLNLTTLDTSLRCLNKLGESFDKVLLFAGNHDLYYKDKRDISSTDFAKFIPGITVVDDIYVEEGVALVPWLVGNEWKKVQKLKTKYIFGHFELPSFLMNAMVRMPDHGDLKTEDFSDQQYVFSGHFHKRQSYKNVHYIGSPFPHNYADAWDDARGMMILDQENNLPPFFIDWPFGPKYRTLPLSQLIDEADEIIKENMYLRVSLDLPISYEEASFIKDTFVSKYKCRDISLIPQKNIDELSTDLDISTFVSVDQIVSTEISELDTESYSKNLLLDIYNNLEQLN